MIISRRLIKNGLNLQEQQEPHWSYTVDTTKINASNKKTSIPFDLYNVNDTSITVDWGDNTTSTFTSANYSSSTALDKTTSTGLIHTYSEPGVYTVKVISDDFDKVKLYNRSISPSSNTPIYYYKNTITEINNAFPKLNVTSFSNCFYQCSSLTSISSELFDNNTAVTSFFQCFFYCTSLTSIPSGLFNNNTLVTNFGSCFYGCSSITEISTGLFDNCTSATRFQSCFQGCSSLSEISQDLFRYNTAVTDFSSCFRACSSLSSIPSGLFDNNTEVTTFSNCFYECSSLTSIPADLFKYNINVTNFQGCFQNCSSINNFTIHIGSELVTSVSTFVTNKSGTTRTVYVPSGSTTQTKFNSVASSLGLTVIGE